MAVAGMTMPTIAQLIALRRRKPSALGLYCIYALSKGTPPSNQGVSRAIFGALFKTPAIVGGVGQLIKHINENVVSGRSSISANLSAERRETWDMLFSDRVLVELIGSSMLQAHMCPSIGHDVKRQQEWRRLSEHVAEHLEKPNASFPGLMSILNKHARQGSCGEGIGYNAEDFSEGFVLGALSDDKQQLDEKRTDISVPEANKFLLKFQRDNDKYLPFLEELRGGGGRLITKADGAPVSLHGEAWRALGSYGQLCLWTLREHHNKTTSGPSRSGKPSVQGSKSTGRQRTTITEDPEEPVVAPVLPPSSLPGLKHLGQSDLMAMLQQLQAQSDSMARAQARQARENARIMSSIGFLTESLAAEDDLSSTD